MHGVEVREIAPSSIDDINKMCVMPGSSHEAALAALKESADAHRQGEAMGARVFGAFVEGGEPVGRIEIMPIEAAPVPLKGDGLWVIRCMWVLDRAKGLGIAGSLMRLALGAAQGSRGVAVLTYPGGCLPPSLSGSVSNTLIRRSARRQCFSARPTHPTTVKYPWSPPPLVSGGLAAPNARETPCWWRPCSA